MRDDIQDLLKTHQPHANCFGGQGVSSNPVRWIGTESGLPASPIWSTGDAGQGDPESDSYDPAGCDTTLQDADVPACAVTSRVAATPRHGRFVGRGGSTNRVAATPRHGRFVGRGGLTNRLFSQVWFWEPGVPIRSLEVMKDVYFRRA